MNKTQSEKAQSTSKPRQFYSSLIPLSSSLPYSSFILHLSSFLLYLLLTLAFIWPVLPHLGQTTPGDFPVDRNQYLWNFWYFKHALVDLRVNPFHTDLLFFPYGTNLFLHAYSPINNLLGLPLVVLFGTIPAYGLIELITFPLAAYGAFLLARYLTKNNLAAFGAGLLYSFSAYHILELKYDQMNLVAIQWIPFYVLFFLKTLDATERRAAIQNGLLALLFLIAVGLSDWYYLTYVALFSGVYWLVRLVRTWRANPRPLPKIAAIILRFGLIWLLTGVALAYLIIGLIRDQNSGRFVPVALSGQELDGSADLLSLWLPAIYHPWWGQSSGLWSAQLNRSGANIAYIASGLAIVGLIWRRKESWGWVVAAVGWLVLSLGPSLRVGGQNTGVPLPYRLLSELPLFNIGRFPERYILMVNLSLAMAAGFGLAALFERLRKMSVRPLLYGAAVLLVFGLAYLESWPGFWPVQPDIGPFAFANYIKADNGRVASNKAVLELPVTKHWTADSSRMLYQTYHARPILGGYLSRKVIDLYRDADPYSLYDFLDLRGFEPDIVSPHTADQWRTLLNYGQMGYVVLYPNEFESKAQMEKARRMLAAIFGPNASPDFADTTAQVYAVPQAPPTPAEPIVMLGKGWYEVENIGNGKMQRWINLQTSDSGEVIVLSGRESSEYRLEFEAAPFQKSRRLQVWLNGAMLDIVTIDGLKTYGLDNLPLKPGPNRLSFRPDPAEGYASPGGGDTRHLAVALLNVQLIKK